MTNSVDGTTYQKVVADMTVDIPLQYDMNVQSKVKGRGIGKQCILTPEAKFVETNYLLVARL